MINKALLNSKNVGILNDISIQNQELGNIFLYRNPVNNYVELHDKSLYPYDTIMIDSSNFVKLYAKNIIDLSFDSALFVGLGLGILPYLSQDFTSVIDVIEKNEHIIQMCNNIGHLNGNVNIINNDIFLYDTNIKYDLIVFDIWNDKENLFNQQYDLLSNFFAKNLNSNGEMHFPILNYV